MVRKFLPAFLALLLITTGVGCNHDQVAQLPPPRFSPPVISQNTAPRPVPSVRPQVPYALPAGIPRNWIPVASSRPWRWIVIHHSATPSGGAAKFDRDHREKGWDELGYHFVIGNGTETGNGQIEVGPRWPKQKWGAHTRTPDNRFNEFGIGICLVGNFDVQRPTPEQMRSLAKVVAFLMKRYNIPPDRILGHKDAKPTDCPGSNLNLAVVRRMAVQMLADSGTVLDPDVREASVELMSNASLQD